MKIGLIQINTPIGDTDGNFTKAVRNIRDAAKLGCDTVVLPETFNTGYFPHDNLPSYCDNECERTIKTFSSFAKELSINIVSGSVSSLKGGRTYNTSLVFDRCGNIVSDYDKTHLFTPMNEDGYYEKGNHFSDFMLDGVKCGILICYDIRFPEAARILALRGIQILFVVSQWPMARKYHLETLAKGRAIENQMFTVVCNSCGESGGTVFAGSSIALDPWGNVLASAGDFEETVIADIDLSVIDGIRSSINVFRDRREELYNLITK